MPQVEVAQAALHRGFAVGRGPGCTQSAIGARPEAQCALALFLEDELIVDKVAPAAAPFGGLVLVDPRPDRVDGVEVVAAHILDSEEDLAAVRIEPVPGLAAAVTAACDRRGGAGLRRSSGGRCGGMRRSAWPDEFVRQAQVGTRRLAPSRLANPLAFN